MGFLEYTIKIFTGMSAGPIMSFFLFPIMSLDVSFSFDIIIITIIDFVDDVHQLQASYLIIPPCSVRNR